MYARKEKVYPAYVSKHNSNRVKQVTFLTIPNEEWWHYITLKKLQELLRGIPSKDHDGFYCLNFLHSFQTENKRESHKKYERIKIFVMLQCLLKTLKY